MNRLIVNPMPQSTAIPYSCNQDAPAGSFANPSLMVAQENVKKYLIPTEACKQSVVYKP